LIAAAALVALGVACGGKKREESAGTEEKTEHKVKSERPALAASTQKPAPPVIINEPEDRHPDDHAVVCEAPGTDADAVLDFASRRYREGAFAEAHACSELAADLVPHAVESQHLRAAALSALGRYDQAQVAFAMALALDPDDPETLADAADFYINILPPKRRATIQVGLEYARRGSDRAGIRRRLDRSLRGRLLLLEAEALNDLGAPDEALVRVDEALTWSSKLVAAQHERAVSLFNLCKFKEAERAFMDVLARAPTDAYAHHHLGLIYERQRRPEAEAHFQRARALAPAEFSPPVLLDNDEFRAEVLEAIAELPKDLATMMSKVELELVDVPSDEDLLAADPPFSPTILGLFRGLPAGVEDSGDDVPPRAIVLYRRNLARAVHSREELDRQIRKTLLHEIGHLQGLDEDELRRRGLD
jgi:predicted Zn-dependent protease with MMP-like domain/Flp pilus assembly protein TadD